MIKWSIRDENGVVSIDIVGHAGYAKRGQDIVCASVSTLVYFFVYSVKAVDENSIKQLNILNGDVKLKLVVENIKPLLEVFQLMLKDVERQYPSCLMENSQSD